MSRMSDIGVYVVQALDRIEVAGPLTADALDREAIVLREAAAVLEARAASRRCASRVMELYPDLAHGKALL